MKKLEPKVCLERRILDEVLAHWQYRGIGTTQAMIDGNGMDCIFLVMDERQAIDIEQRGVNKKKIMTVEDLLSHKLRGLKKPLIVDHYVMDYLIRGSLRDAFEEGLIRK